MTETQGALSRKKVLIVDDEPILREVIRETLGEEGLEIFEAGNGLEGLQLTRELKPDVIISDLKMPKMSGLQMLASLKEEGLLMPVIFLTGFGDKSALREAWRLGAFDFLDKPFEPSKLIEVVQVALKAGIVFNQDRPSTFLDRNYFTHVNLALPVALYERAKNHCDEKGIALQTFMQRLLEKEFLDSKNR